MRATCGPGTALMRGSGRERMVGGRGRHGFTLVELMVVVGVVVLLAGLLVTAGVALVEHSERRQTRLAMTQLDAALREWEVRADRKLTWWNGPGDGPPELAEVHASTGEVYILSEMLGVISRQSDVAAMLAAIDPELLHTFSAQDAFAWLPGGVVEEAFLGKLTVLDAWGTAIYATHPGRAWRSADGGQADADGTIQTYNEQQYGICLNRQVVFVSAGPDRRFGIASEFDNVDNIGAGEINDLKREARRDNLYSAPVGHPASWY